MNNRRAIVLTATVVIVAGVIVVMTLRGFASRSTAPGPDATSAPAAATVVAEPLAVNTPQASEAPPPWARSQSNDIDVVAPSGADPADPVRAEQMRQLQQSMRGIMAEATRRSDATNDHLRKALDTLQEMDDPSVTSQINLDAVRQNLEVSIKMQALSQELQQVMAEPTSPARQQRLDASLNQFRQLQSQLRQDVRAPGASAVLPTLPASTLPVAPLPTTAP